MTPKVLTYHTEGPCVPLVVYVSLVGNHCPTVRGESLEDSVLTFGSGAVILFIQYPLLLKQKIKTHDQQDQAREMLL